MKNFSWISIITRLYKLCAKTRNKNRDAFIQKDNVVTACQSIWKSLYAYLYYGSCTFTKFDWITWLWWLCLLLIPSLFPFPHKISGVSHVFSYPMVIPHFVFFSDPLKEMEGNYLAVLINLRNLHYRHKVFQVTHKSRHCTQFTWIIFQFCFIFTTGEKKREGN